jgi:hypothetical protein
MEVKIVVVILVTISVIALILYRIFEGQIWAPKIELCEENEVCVRLCCNNETTCDDFTMDDIRNLDQAKNLSSDFRLIKEEPCKEHYDSDARWHFLKVCFLSV